MLMGGFKQKTKEKNGEVLFWQIEMLSIVIMLNLTNMIDPLTWQVFTLYNDLTNGPEQMEQNKNKIITEQNNQSYFMILLIHIQNYMYRNGTQSVYNVFLVKRFLFWEGEIKQKGACSEHMTVTVMSFGFLWQCACGSWGQRH